MTYWSGYVSCHMAITMTMIKNKKYIILQRIFFKENIGFFSDKENIGFFCRKSVNITIFFRTYIIF